MNGDPFDLPSILKNDRHGSKICAIQLRIYRRIFPLSADDRQAAHSETEQNQQPHENEPRKHFSDWGDGSRPEPDPTGRHAALHLRRLTTPTHLSSVH